MTTNELKPPRDGHYLEDELKRVNKINLELLKAVKLLHWTYGNSHTGQEKCETCATIHKATGVK